MILTETTLEVYDLTSGLKKFCLNLSDPNIKLHLCDVYAPPPHIEGITKARPASLFSIRSYKPDGKSNTLIPKNKIEDEARKRSTGLMKKDSKGAKKDKLLNKSKQETFHDNCLDSNLKIFDSISFKAENEIEKINWLIAISKVRLRCLGENPEEYDMVFPVSDDDSSNNNNNNENDDSKNKKRYSEKKTISNQVVDSRSYSFDETKGEQKKLIDRLQDKSSNSSVEVSNPLYESNKSSLHPPTNISKKVYYFYVDYSDYRGLYSRIIEFITDGFYNYAIPGGIDKSSLSLATIFVVGLVLNITLLLLFALNFRSQYKSLSPGTFLSYSNLNPDTSPNPTYWERLTKTLCYYIPREVTDTYFIDSNGYWSTNNRFTEENTVAQVIYTGFNSTFPHRETVGLWLLQRFEDMNYDLERHSFVKSAQILTLERNLYTTGTGISDGMDDLDDDTEGEDEDAKEEKVHMQGRISFEMSITPSHLFSQTANLGTNFGIAKYNMTTNETIPETATAPALHTKATLKTDDNYGISLILDNSHWNLTKLHQVNVTVGDVSYGCNEIYLKAAKHDINQEWNSEVKELCFQYFYGTFISNVKNRFIGEYEKYNTSGTLLDNAVFFNFSLYEYTSFLHELYYGYSNAYDPERNKGHIDPPLTKVPKQFDFNFDSLNLASLINHNTGVFDDYIKKGILHRLSDYTNNFMFSSNPNEIFYPNIKPIPIPSTGWGWYTSSLKTNIRMICRDIENTHEGKYNTTTCAVPLSEDDYGGFVSPKFTAKINQETTEALGNIFFINLYFQASDLFQPCNLDTSADLFPQCEYLIATEYLALIKNYTFNSGAQIKPLGRGLSNAIQYGLNDLSEDDIDCSLSQFNESFYCIPPVLYYNAHLFRCQPPNISIILSVLGSAFANVQLLALILAPLIVTIVTVIQSKTSKNEDETEEDIVDAL